MKILAVDPSLSATGLAWQAGYEVFHTHPNPKDSHKGLPDRMHAIADRIIGTLVDEPADLVIIEDPLTTPGSATIVLAGLAWVIRTRLCDYGQEWIGVANSTRTKWATGNGNAKKAEVLYSAQRYLMYDGFDDNIADALWLHDMATCAYALDGDNLTVAKRSVLGNIPWPIIGGNDPGARWGRPKPKTKKARNL